MKGAAVVLPALTIPFLMACAHSAERPCQAIASLRSMTREQVETRLAELHDEHGRPLIVAGPTVVVCPCETSRDFGGEGEQHVHGGAAEDRLFGGTGEERAHGGAAEDRLFGGTGEERAHGGAAEDRLFGGDGEQRAHGSRGEVRAHGGAHTGLRCIETRRCSGFELRGASRFSVYGGRIFRASGRCVLARGGVLPDRLRAGSTPRLRVSLRCDAALPPSRRRRLRHGPA
jgi:hypothetical protein